MFFFCVCAYVEAWFPIGVVDNSVVQSCLNSWTRHVLFWISTQRHVFFHSCKDIPTEFFISYLYSSRQFVFSRTSAEMLVWTTFYLSLYPLLFDCFFILCFFFKFSAFSLDLEVQKASVLIIWILFRCFNKLFLSGNFSLGNLVNWFFQHIVKLPEFSYWVQPLSGKFVCSTSRINSIGGSMFFTIY